jgi:2-dehydro-3-deoxy-D-arabinonate dehydratase
MNLAKLAIDGRSVWAFERDGFWISLRGTLDDLLIADDLAAAALAAADAPLCRVADVAPSPAAVAHLLAPIESQEAWAAGVTYRRSQEARKVEAGGADYYDRIYAAERPEIFLKGTRSRAVGPGDAVGIRADAAWNVPEPELALVLNRSMAIVGFTVANDVSSRDIEGTNPLYLPQAKIYDRSLALGPTIVTAEGVDPERLGIHLRIRRGGVSVFEGSTSTAQLNRSFADLAGYLGRCQRFPVGAILLTGTGVVPPDDFTLAAGDLVDIRIDGVGELTNPVVVVPL